MRFSKVTIIIVLLIIPLGCIGQPSILWQTCFGTSYDDYFTDAVQTTDSGFLATFFYSGTDGDADPDDTIVYPARVIKFDSDFNIQWQRQYGGNDGYNNFIRILPLVDGYYFIGYSSSTNGDLGGTTGGRDFSILKTDFEGNRIWARCYGSANDDFIQSAVLTSDKGVLITGYSNHEGGDIPFHYGEVTIPDAIIMMIDSLGDIRWVKVMGGTGYDSPLGDPIKIDENIYQLHIYSTSNDFDLTGTEGIGELKRWIINISSTGEILDDNCISATNDFLRFDGRYYFLNYQTMIVGSGNPDSEMFPASDGHELDDGAVAFFNEDIELSYMKQFGGSNIDLLYAATWDEDKNYYFIGTSMSQDFDLPDNYNDGENKDYWLLKTDSNFNKVWSLNFGGSFAYGDLNGKSLICNIILSESVLYFFGMCMVADVLPDYDIECGHTSELPGMVFSDAWLVAFDVQYDPIEDANVEHEFLIYPNPADQFVTLDMKMISGESELNIYSPLGCRVYTADCTGQSSIVINTNILSNGLYLIVVSNNTRVINSVPFIVHH